MSKPWSPTQTNYREIGYDRAAQFSPFAALTGFDDVIHDHHHPEITVTYFVPDSLKQGGEYEEFTGKVRKIDSIQRTIIFLAANGRSSGKIVRIDDISEIHGELVNYMDE